MITKHYTGKYKTTTAIEFAIENARLGDIIFSSFKHIETIRCINIMADIFLYAGIKHKVNKMTRVIEVFGNKIRFVNRDADRIRGLIVFCAVIDDYNIFDDDIYFKDSLMCRLRQRVVTPYSSKHYFNNELFITGDY